MTRRDFLRKLVGAAVGTTLVAALSAPPAAPAKPPALDYGAWSQEQATFLNVKWRRGQIKMTARKLCTFKWAGEPWGDNP